MSLNGTVWAPIGPSPIDQGAISANGQVTAIAINPNNPNIIYIGTAWGGVWLTRDGGATWTPIFDRAPSLGIGDPGALAIDPVDTNIMYAGTSNRDGSQFSGEATQPPAGLFKSTDSGASWIRLGSGYPSSAPSNASIFFNQVINVVIVDPANHQTVYLASNAGLFVSNDGGFNWTQGAVPAGTCARWCWTRPRQPAPASCTRASPALASFSPPTAGRTGHAILNAATRQWSPNELTPPADGRSRSQRRKVRRRAGAANLSARPGRHSGALRHDEGRRQPASDRRA